MTQKVTVVGAGLAGSECALQLASRGISVELVEQRPVVSSPAHHTDRFAELVCSNSLKSTKEDSAAGILKSELKKMGSFLLTLLLIFFSCLTPFGKFYYNNIIKIKVCE